MDMDEAEVVEARAVVLPSDPVAGATTHIEDHQRIRAALADVDGRLGGAVRPVSAGPQSVPIADTGWRDISGLIKTANGWKSGTLRIRRSGNAVQLLGNDLVRDADATWNVALVDDVSTLAGFLPSQLTFAKPWFATGVYATGSAVMVRDPKNGTDFFSLTWFTNQAWPTTLPGARAADEDTGDGA